jgi:hypothetical protein
MTVTLYLWLPHGGDPGHVSMDVGGTYMSYWPTGQAKAKKDFKLGTSHPAGLPTQYRADQRLEKREASERMTLNGLKEQRMRDAWREVEQNPGRYNMVKRNCATMIAAILEEGSGRKPGFTPHIRIDDHIQAMTTRVFLRVLYLGNSIHMWTPEQVWRYAESLRRGPEAS